MKRFTVNTKCIIALCSLLFFLSALVSCAGLDQESVPDNSEEEQMVFDVDASVCNSNYVNLEKYGVRLCSADTVRNTYVLEAGAELPDIQPGSVLALDADSTGYIVRVSEVERQGGGKIRLTAKSASLSDIFGNTSFILSTATQEAGTRTKAGGVPIIYPVAMCYHDENGTLVREDFTVDTKAVSGLLNLWENGINYDGATLYKAGNFSLTMDKSNIKGSLDLEFYLSFGGFKKLQENVQDFYTQYRSSSVAMNAKLIGTLNVNQVVRAHVDGSFDTRNGHNLSDYNELVKHKVFPDVDFKFLVGDIPVWIKVGTDLFREVNLQGEGSLDFTAGFSNTTTLSSGFNWSQQGGISPVASADNAFNRVGPTLTGQGKLTGKLWPFYPRISVRFYTVLGPTFDLKPYIQSTLEGGFQLGAGDSYAAWSLTNEAGVDFKAGLSTFFMNYENARFVETNDLNLGSKELYRSPVGLERIDKSKCTIGTQSTLEFNVTDYDGISGSDILTILPQVVSFEGDGTLSRHYALAKNGRVSVDWTPEKSTDKLLAILYSPSGTIIDECEVYAEMIEAETGEATSVTSNSAVVSGSYEGLFEGCKYGIDYWSNSSAYTVYGDGTFGEEKFSEEFDLKDLKPNTEYHYCAVIEYDGQVIEGETRTFTTKSGEGCQDANHVHAIDLGLSVKWACCNVGASSPEEYGGLYAWGETETKSVYNEVTYKYAHGIDTDGDGYYEEDGHYDNLGSDISGTRYDVAHVKWGGSWRMPTEAEFSELMSNCKSEWTFDYNGTGANGRIFTSRINGNSIFLPAAGCSADPYNGRYWSGTFIYGSGGSIACAFYLYSGDVFTNFCQRCVGQSVRPVTE